MVEYTINLNSIFSSLSDPTRRDILKRVSKKELSVSEIAASYELTFAGISKHLQVLEKANLINKRRVGNQQFIATSAPALKEAAKYLEQYKKLWDDRFEALDDLLKDKHK